MDKSRVCIRGYLIAGFLGAAAGAITVAMASRALPRMMAHMMSSMMAQMGGEGCDPEEM